VEDRVFQPVWWRALALDVARLLAAFVLAGAIGLALFGAQVLPGMGRIALGYLLLSPFVAWLHGAFAGIRVDSDEVVGPAASWIGWASIPLGEIDRAKGPSVGGFRRFLGPQRLESHQGHAIRIDTLSFDPEEYRQLRAALGF
jgi:hypothetical protein